MRYDEGINNLELDAVAQIEHNRREIVNNKQSISTLQSQVNQLLSQAPAGFLPQVYYGLTRGNQTYRFNENYTVTVTTQGNLNDAYEFITNEETEDYIAAVGVKTAENQVQVVIRGDYNIAAENFTLVNMRTGESVNVEINNALSLQDASYLGQFSAQNNREKQITVLKDLQSGENNAIYASIDRNSDGVYNWTRIGGYVNGKNGISIYAATASTMSAVLENARVNDIILIGETFTYNSVSYAVGNLYKINSLDPLNLEQRGNIRGAQGLTGATGLPGQNGNDGYTPYIQDGYWYINGVNTNVQAIGQDGQDGQDGQSFSMQSGLYSTPANYGQTGNVDTQGNSLLQLPTLPQSNISGKGYVVYDPLTTPLDPYYDLYFANNSDTTWTIIHPFSGIRGQDGVDGYTPYIQNGYWYINGVNTGVQATGQNGQPGVGIQSVVAGTPYVSGTKTITPIIITLTNTTQTTVNVEAENGSGGGNLYLHNLTITGKITSNIPQGYDGYKYIIQLNLYNNESTQITTSNVSNKLPVNDIVCAGVTQYYDSGNDAWYTDLILQSASFDFTNNSLYVNGTDSGNSFVTYGLTLDTTSSGELDIYDRATLIP